MHISNEQCLKMFYEELYKNNSIDPEKGLCSQLSKWLHDNYHIAVSSYKNELVCAVQRTLFLRNMGNSLYPFNKRIEGPHYYYSDENENGIIHLNPYRIAFVRHFAQNTLDTPFNPKTVDISS